MARRSITDIAIGQILSRMLKDPDKLTISGAEKLLDSYMLTEDISTSAGIEKVYKKIDTALQAGKFGDDIGITDFVKNYMSTLTQSGISRTQTLSDRKKLYTLTNPSNVKKLITEAQVMGDATKSIESIENKVVDLSIARDKLADKKMLSTALDTRFNTAISMLDKSLREFETDGLNEKEITRIMKGTYASMVNANANIEASKQELIMTSEFRKPALQEAQYIKILNDIESTVTDYDDKLNFLNQEYSYLNMAQTVAPSGGGPTSEFEKKGNDLAMSSAFRQVRLIGQYSQPYKDAYDNLKKLRKKHPDKMVYVDFSEIMNKKVHNELYNYVPPVINGSNNTTGFQSFSPKTKVQELNTINNMLKNRTITFTKDIFDSYGEIWKQEGESISGLGSPDVNKWKLKKINREKDDSLNNMVISVPYYGSTVATTRLLGLAPGQVTQQPTETSIKLTPEDFIIEDDPRYSGAGYKIVPYGKASYNIYNNLYELIQK